MFSVKKCLLGVGLGAGLLLVGCQSDGSNVPASHAMASDAVQCDKCQVTWVRVPTNGKQGAIIQYNWIKRDPCPDCMDAVSNFFATGTLKHACKACGGNMVACEAH